MPVLKTAIKLIFRSPLYLVIYLGLFGVLGLFVSGVTDNAPSEMVVYEQAQRPVAVIDRDNSIVSQGVTDFIAERATIIELKDEKRVLQDAVAQNQTAYILIIPEGFGEEFVSAARSGQTVPELISIVSVESISGFWFDHEVSNYLSALRISAAIDSDLAFSELVERAELIASIKTPLEVIQATESVNRNSLLPFFMNWSAYPLTMGIGILVALVFTSFQAGELKRRNGSAPISSTSMNIQITASGFVIVLMGWGFICLLSLLPVVGGLDIWINTPLAAALLALAALIYALIPLAIGFLLSQFGMNQLALNGFVNIVALAMMFLSGIMMGGSAYLDGMMLTIGRFMPAYWYSEALSAVTSAGEFSWSSLNQYFTCLGIMLLFSLAIFSVALFVGRLRVQTADAGGNTAAEAV